jgi:hypothetical protein
MRKLRLGCTDENLNDRKSRLPIGLGGPTILSHFDHHQRPRPRWTLPSTSTLSQAHSPTPISPMPKRISSTISKVAIFFDEPTLYPKAYCKRRFLSISLAAALSITTLYRSSRQTSKRAYNSGYAAACQDILSMIQQGVSAGGDHAGENPMSVGRIMDWVEARCDAIKAREEEEEEEEQKEKDKDTQPPQSGPKPPPSRTRRQVSTSFEITPFIR